MSLTANSVNDIDALAASKRKSEIIDTSLLVEELRREYQKSESYIPVDFRKLVGWVKLGDQLTHQIHPYPAKLLPHIAHFFVRASILQKQGRQVLDPFCGSGTVALEASLAGYTPLVADANPLALLITKVKTTPYDTEMLRETLYMLVSEARIVRTAPVIPVVNQHLWYSSDRKLDLERLMLAISEIDCHLQRDFFRVCFSVAARRLSLADPSISVPVRLKTKEKFEERTNNKILERLSWLSDADTFLEFSRVCEMNIDRVASANEALDCRSAAIQIGVDARNLIKSETYRSGELDNESVSLIVTSPPYGSAQKYVRASSLSLNWLGISAPNELTELEWQSIGREHVPRHRWKEIDETLPIEYEGLIQRIRKTNETRAKITRQYLCEMKSALLEMTRATAKGGRIVLIVGNNQVCGELLRNDDFIITIMNELGLCLELGLVDQIKSRGLLTKRNKTASVISLETVLVFSKL